MTITTITIYIPVGKCKALNKKYSSNFNKKNVINEILNYFFLIYKTIYTSQYSFIFNCKKLFNKLKFNQVY